jgi:uncharacterized protein (DUF305 family)
MKLTIQTTARAIVVAGVLAASILGTATSAQTPGVSGCAGIGTPAAGMPPMDPGMMTDSTPMPGTMGVHHSTPMTDMHAVEFDLMYIDMMIPHHESVIALAEVAQHELSHPDLIEIAEAIVETQDAEIREMELLRDEWYGDAETVSMDMMMEMPGMGADMPMMAQQMNAEWQVQAFCTAENRDLAFIDQVIPHHQMAIDASEAALEEAVHPELEAIAQRVIEDQQHEIDELEALHAELAATATPAT